MSIKKRIERLEELQNGGDEFHFILIDEEPNTYRGSDGRTYTQRALTAKLAAIGWEYGGVVVNWDPDPDAEPTPDTLYIGWDDEKTES